MKASHRLRLLGEDRIDKFGDYMIFDENNFNLVFLLLTFFILCLIFMTNLIV